jgi:hypothetical protein
VAFASVGSPFIYAGDNVGSVIHMVGLAGVIYLAGFDTLRS